MSHIRSPAGLAPRPCKRVYLRKKAGCIEKPRPNGKHLGCGAATKTPIGFGKYPPRAKYVVY